MFEPLAAHIAGLTKDGLVVSGHMLADPAIYPTVIVEFDWEDELYRAMYHDQSNTWEFPEWAGSYDSHLKFDDLLVGKAIYILPIAKKLWLSFKTRFSPSQRKADFKSILQRKWSGN